MSTTIKIKCIDQTLTYEGTPTVASGGVNEDYVQFEFCPLWDGFSKVAVFYQNKGEIYYSLVSTENIAVVPKEVIATKGIMYLGVLGVKDNVTRTSKVLEYRIENGALDGFTPVEPTPEIYQQILTELQTIRDLSTETLSNEQAFEKAITEQQESYETDLNNQWNTYKTNLNGEWSTYKTNLTKQQTDYESKITKQQTDYETKITKQQNDYETLINSEFDEYKVEVPTIASDKATEIVNAKMGDYYKKTETYSNTEINNKLSSKVDTTTLANYYKKTETYSKTEIDSFIVAKEITLGTTWTEDSTNGYSTQDVSVTGIKSTDTPILDVQTSGTLENIQAQQTEWAKVVQATTYTNGIKFYATEATTMSLTILIKR